MKNRPTFFLRKQETGEHPEESTGTPKLTDKKYRRVSLEEYRHTFLQVPRIIDRLKEPDKTKYEIYTAIKSGLKHAKDWQQL